MWFPVDVEETAQQYTFVADVPGLGKNDIKVLLLPVLLVKASLVILLLACVLKLTLVLSDVTLLPLLIFMPSLVY